MTSRIFYFFISKLKNFDMLKIREEQKRFPEEMKRIKQEKEEQKKIKLNPDRIAYKFTMQHHPEKEVVFVNVIPQYECINSCMFCERKSMDNTRADTRKPVMPHSTSRRYCPVWDWLQAATSSGVPETTTHPPLMPPSGPRSTI